MLLLNNHGKVKMKTFLNEKRVLGRECGQCTACCIIPSIEVLNKPARTPCVNLCGNGCSIYKDRPLTCQQFECIWRAGWAGGKDHSPDKLGLMLTLFEHNGAQVLHVWRLKGTFDEEKINKVLLELGKSFSFIYVDVNGDCQLIGSKRNNQIFLNRHGNFKND